MRIRGLAGATLALAVLVACSKVTPENYSRIGAGMSRAEVYAILGNPTEVTGGAVFSLDLSTEVWKGPEQTISISFAGDKVTVKRIEATAR